jgi:hypothetical protein
MLACLLTCLSAPAFGAGETPDLASLRNDAFAAYRAEDYETASRVASRYVERARTEGRAGRELAAVSFVLGHSRYEVHRASGDLYAGDYRAEVIAPLEESLRVLRDDPAFKNMLLSNAYHTLWSLTGRRDLDVEGRTHWHLFKSILIREAGVRDQPKDSDEYDLFARHLLFYLERCLDLARDSGSPLMYVHRIRSLAPLGFGTGYDERFLQIHELTYFDNGNMKAAALWQRGLDSMLDAGAGADTVLSAFVQAADLTRRARDRAEIYRQMADFASTIDEPVRRVQAAEFARKAYDLAPDDAEIRKQFGSALHVLSYGAFARSEFDEALKHAQESTTFDWEGMEVSYFDLSRAAAELGRQTDALMHGEQAYRLAKVRVEGSALQPFAQNYINILRQFGQEGLALRILTEEAALGVR